MNRESFQPGDLVDLAEGISRWSFHQKQFGLVLGWRHYPDGDHCVKVLWDDGEQTNTHPSNLVKL